MHYEKIWPPPLLHIVEYIAFMSQSNYSFKTISCHVAAISYYNKINNIFDHTQSFIVKRMLAGLNRLHRFKDNRLPITITMLFRILPNLLYTCSSNYEASLFSAAYSLAFSALLRVSEISFKSVNNYCLQFNDVTVTASYVKLFLRSSKNDQLSFGSEIVIPFSQNNKFLSDSLHNYLSGRPNLRGPFLIHYDGSPVTSYQFNQVLKKVLEFSGMPANLYKSHSFRIGGATYLHLLGKSDEEIKAIGRWKSNAYKGYIRLNIPDMNIAF